jgi:hypothetical protein
LYDQPITQENESSGAFDASLSLDIDRIDQALSDSGFGPMMSKWGMTRKKAEIDDVGLGKFIGNYGRLWVGVRIKKSVFLN